MPGLRGDQSHGGEPDGGPPLRRPRHGRAMDEGRQAGGEDDATFLPSHPRQRGALWLSVTVHNLGSLWRRLASPMGIANWSLISLQEQLIKTGGRLVKHAGYYSLLFDKSHITSRLFAGMLRKIATPPVPTG
jgi:hypothetical protein